MFQSIQDSAVLTAHKDAMEQIFTVVSIQVLVFDS
jgi:hypothetical protein